MVRALLIACLVFSWSAYAEPPTHAAAQPLLRVEDRPVECPEKLKAVAIHLEKMTKNGTPWKSVSEKELRFGFTVGKGDEKQWFLVGYSGQDLLKSKLKFERCAGLENTVRIVNPGESLLVDSHLEGPQKNGVEMNMVMPKDWNPLFTLSHLQISEDTKIPLTVTNLDSFDQLPEGFDKKIFTSPEIMPIAVTHELFHLYQFKRFKSLFLWATDKRSETIAACRANAEWMKDMEAELGDWNRINELRKEAGKKEEIRKILIGLLERRAKSELSEETKKCWRWMEHGECIEGVPTYFSAELARRAGNAVGGDPLSLLPDQRLTVKNPHFFDEARGIYYLTGAYLLQAMDDYAGDFAWHEEIEKGTTVADTLRKLLEPK